MNDEFKQSLLDWIEKNKQETNTVDEFIKTLWDSIDNTQLEKAKVGK